MNNCVYVMLHAWSHRAKHAFFCGTDLNCQSCLDRGSVGVAIGMVMFGFSCSEPPASKMRTETFWSSESLFASTHPAEPAPTVIKQKNHRYIKHYKSYEMAMASMQRRIKISTLFFFTYLWYNHTMSWVKWYHLDYN